MTNVPVHAETGEAATEAPAGRGLPPGRCERCLLVGYHGRHGGGVHQAGPLLRLTRTQAGVVAGIYERLDEWMRHRRRRR